MANLKLRVTYLWTDERVLLEDFAKKISRDMTEWAQEFFRINGFDLDVKPGQSVSSVPLAQKFALVKNDGVRPDMDLNRRLAEEYDARRDAVKKQEEAADQEARRLQRELDQLPPGDPRFSALLDEVKQANERYFKRVHEWIDLFHQESAEKAKGDYETWLRIQMSFKWALDKIGDEKRMNVVFCKFARQQMSMRAQDAGGETLFAIAPTLWNGILLWPSTFIIVDIDKGPVRSVAHEVVHAAGRAHPPPQTVIKNLGNLLAYKPEQVTGSLLNRLITQAANQLNYEKLFKKVPGAYFDGPPNDVMNYDAKDVTPAEAVLSDADKRRLTNAFFVI